MHGLAEYCREGGYACGRGIVRTSRSKIPFISCLISSKLRFGSRIPCTIRSMNASPINPTSFKKIMHLSVEPRSNCFAKSKAHRVNRF